MDHVENNSRQHLVALFILLRNLREWIVLINLSKFCSFSFFFFFFFFELPHLIFNSYPSNHISLSITRGMQDCFRQYPEVYPTELDDDEPEPQPEQQHDGDKTQESPKA